MPKINIEYDTETRDIVCNVAGSVVDVDGIYVFRDCNCSGEEKKYYIEVALKPVDMDGIKTYTRICAKQEANSVPFGPLFIVPKEEDWFSKVLKK